MIPQKRQEVDFLRVLESATRRAGMRSVALYCLYCISLINLRLLSPLVCVYCSWARQKMQLYSGIFMSTQQNGFVQHTSTQQTGGSISAQRQTSSPSGQARGGTSMGGDGSASTAFLSTTSIFLLNSTTSDTLSPESY